MELPAEVLAVVHVDVVINVLVHHVRLKHGNSYPRLTPGSFHTVPSADYLTNTSSNSLEQALSVKRKSTGKTGV